MAEDQAGNLRRRMTEQRRSDGGSPRPQSRGRRAVLVAVTSGKGGVGKSNFALNCAILLAGLKQRVLLVDADTNLANLDILMGLNPSNNLSDVIAGDKTFAEILVEGPSGIHIMPGSSGVLEMIDLDETVKRSLVGAFADLQQNYDYLLIDTGAGLTPSIVSYVTSSDEVVLITNPEPTAITDAYAMLKISLHQNPTLRVRLMVNLAESQHEALDVYDRFELVVKNFINIPIEYLGYLPKDQNIPRAVARQTPFVLAYPRSPAAIALEMMTRKLLKTRDARSAGQDGSLLEKLLNNKAMNRS